MGMHERGEVHGHGESVYSDVRHHSAFYGRTRSAYRRAFERFSNGLGDPNLCTIVSGARGTGKTALLSFMVSEAESQGWITARTTAAEGMLEDILDQALVSARNFLDALGGRKLSGVSIGRFVSFEWDNEAPRVGNWRTQMNALLDQLAEQDIGLLITVDEVKVTVPEMKGLAQVYQHFVTEGRKVALLMAGLPQAVSALFGGDDVPFLRRARKHVLGRSPTARFAMPCCLPSTKAGEAFPPKRWMRRLGLSTAFLI